MKKTITLVSMIFSIGFFFFVRSQPVIFSEFYIENDSTWKIELSIKDSVYLDEFAIGTRNSSWTYIKNCRIFYPGEVYVVTQDDLKGKLKINFKGDSVYLMRDVFDNIYEIDHFTFDASDFSESYYNKNASARIDSFYIHNDSTWKIELFIKDTIETKNLGIASEKSSYQFIKKNRILYPGTKLSITQDSLNNKVYFKFNGDKVELVEATKYELAAIDHLHFGCDHTISKMVNYDWVTASIEDFTITNDSVWEIKIYIKRSATSDDLAFANNNGQWIYLKEFTIDSGNYLYITSDDLENKLRFNSKGDVIQLWQDTGDNIYNPDNYYFGNTNISCFSKMNSKRSLVFQKINKKGVFEPIYWKVKDTVPSFGTNPNQSNTTGIFNGYVKYKNGKPVYNVLIQCYEKNDKIFTNSYYDFDLITTNQLGYFNHAMYFKKYHIKILTIDKSEVLLEQDIEISPDYKNYYEFILDFNTSESNSINQMIGNDNMNGMNYPNPFKEATTIVYNKQKNSEKAIIKIVDINGKLVFSNQINNTKTGLYQLTNFILQTGSYFYFIESSDNLISKGKLLVK